MTPRQVGVTVDCADAAQLAAFWERFLGYARRPGAARLIAFRGGKRFSARRAAKGNER